jgi:hypothetical protein
VKGVSLGLTRLMIDAVAVWVDRSSPMLAVLVQPLGCLVLVGRLRHDYLKEVRKRGLIFIELDDEASMQREVGCPKLG